MTTKTRGAARAMFFSSASALPMLRGPQVAYAPLEEGGGGGDDNTPEEFREQPGDREPEPGEETPPAAEALPAEGDPPAEEEEPPAEEEPPEEEPPAEGDDPPAEEPPPRQKDWKDRQIEKLRAKEAQAATDLAEAKRRAEAAEALLAAPAGERDAAALEQTREQVRQEEAAKLREENRYKAINTGLEKMDEAGKKTFSKTWEARIKDAQENFRDEMIARPDFLEAITDLPNAAAVYHELAGDPDKMDAVLKMPAHKMGMELANMATRLAKPAPKPVSRVPAPIVPLGEPGVEDLPLDDPRISQEEFNRRMDAEERKAAEARR